MSSDRNQTQEVAPQSLRMQTAEKGAPQTVCTNISQLGKGEH